MEHMAVPLLIALLIGAGALAQPSDLIRNPKQITSGGQNAEAYWSPDGKRLVFQATRDGGSCDQIYVMAADGNGVRRVSNGQGATTCGFFLPDGEHVLYASTHGGGAACPPRPDRTKGYVWAIPSSYDIYVARLDGTVVRQLTKELGYDAEATVNWSQKKIVYTSVASGDLDLWSMDLNGTGRKRLTTAVGYDGGAFLSRDGRKLVWRAHRPGEGANLDRYKDLLSQQLTAPMKMELFVANADGSGTRQITDFGCASFAPQFTPDGKHILFSSNKHNCDSRNFELYLIDVDGGNLRQVTSFGGFTSFPDFSPDGKQVVFTSSWKAKSPYEFNIFVAEWSQSVTGAPLK